MKWVRCVTMCIFYLSREKAMILAGMIPDGKGMLLVTTLGELKGEKISHFFCVGKLLLQRIKFECFF